MNKIMLTSLTLLFIFISLPVTLFGQSTGTFIDDRDGQTYKWVRIGEQVWMAENLRYLPSVVGPDAASETKPYYYVYDYDGFDVASAKATDNYLNYGVLYNWPAAYNACPTGWHLPSHDAFTELEYFVCEALGNLDCATKFPFDNSTWGWRGTNEGNALKSCRQIDSPVEGACNTSEHPRWAFYRTHYHTDAFGFSALPGGYRSGSGSFDLLGNFGDWWTATDYSPTYAWFRSLFSGNGDVERTYFHKALGFSVRCIKDVE